MHTPHDNVGPFFVSPCITCIIPLVTQEEGASILFWAKQDSLRIILEAKSDKSEFRKNVAGALMAVIAAEGVDAAMKWMSSDGSRAQVDVTLHSPHHEAFSALNEVTGVVHDTDGLTALQLPPDLNLWLVLDVLAATVSEMYALSIKSQGLQRMCDAISVRFPHSCKFCNFVSKQSIFTWGPEQRVKLF